MFRTISLASIAVAALLLSTPALAGHCPKDVAQIDALLKELIAKKPAMEKNEVVLGARKMRDTGLDLHKSGDHEQSLKALHKAMEMLEMKHQ